MAEQTIKAENAIIGLVSDYDPFSDGQTTGYLEFYEERHQPRFSLSSQVISNHLMTILNEPSTPSFWKVGRVIGWMEALMENSPHTFRSFTREERRIVLQKG